MPTGTVDLITIVVLVLLFAKKSISLITLLKFLRFGLPFPYAGVSTQIKIISKSPMFFRFEEKVKDLFLI